MAAPNENISMALYCDFENVALGVRDAKYDKFNIRPVLERLLLKGSIVVKKAYCDWDRYKEFKPQMHEASFELIEIPHVRMSGKNSADIRLVVDALDLCYTKSHVNTFVIISGDSDFSPLVSKLRENAKYVIGVGVKDSTSDLLVANCDEFIFIDDLVRESRRAAASRETRQSPSAARRPAPVEDEHKPKESLEVRRNRAVDLAAETFEALMAERGDNGKIWASALKQAIKRRKPDFNEVYFGFRTFGNLLEEAQGRGLLEIGRDDKSGSYVYRSSRALAAEAANAALATALEPAEPSGRGRRNERAGRNRPLREDSIEAASAVPAEPAAQPAWYEPGADLEADAADLEPMPDTADEAVLPDDGDSAAPEATDPPVEQAREKGRRRGGRKASGRSQPAQDSSPAGADVDADADAPLAAPATAAAYTEPLPTPSEQDPAEAEAPRGIDLPISNAQRRAMRSTNRMPARAKKAGQPKPAQAETLAPPPAPAAPEPAAVPQGAAGHDGSDHGSDNGEGQRRDSRSRRGGKSARARPETDAPDGAAPPAAQGEAALPAPDAQTTVQPTEQQGEQQKRSRPARSRKPRTVSAVE